MRKFMTRGEKGFTLIELLVTVTIIGVLVAIVSIGVGDATSDSDQTANKGTFNQVQAAVDAYMAADTANTVTTLQSGAATAGTDTHYGADGLLTVDPTTSDFNLNLSVLTGGGWLRLHANTALSCVLELGTSKLKGCKNS